MGLSILLDSHALLWSLMEPHKLSPRALKAIKAPQTLLLVSSASAWELGIKHRLGKLQGAEKVVETFGSHLQRLQAEPLLITPGHALAAAALPLHHRDPFDRMLIAQAQLEKVPLVSNDAVFDHYRVNVLW